MDDSVLVLTFEGSQTIEKAEEVRNALLKAIKGKKKEIRIDLSNLENIDLSFLQLLHSASLEAEIKKKKISIKDEIPESILNVIELSGFSRQIGDNPGALFSLNNKMME